MINETMGQAVQAKELAGRDYEQERREEENRAIGIEAVDGGFIITRSSGTREYERGGPRHRQQVVPNADALVGVVNRWASEREERLREGKRGR